MKKFNYCLINTNHNIVSAVSEVNPEFIAICRHLLEKCLNENKPFDIPILGFPKFKVSCNTNRQGLTGIILSPNAGGFNDAGNFDNGTAIANFKVSLQSNKVD